MEQQGFVSKTIYLNNVKGDEIVEKQDQINCSEHMKVIATTILPGTDTYLFHAWIYYLVKKEALEIKNMHRVNETERKEIVKKALPANNNVKINL